MSDVTVIDFYAPWCGPCDQQDEHIDELADRHPDLTIEKVDVDEEMERANEYSVRSVPTIVVEEDGEIYSQFSGLTTADVIEDGLPN